MKNWKLYALTCVVAALMSGSLLAQVNFDDDFESYTLNTGGDDGPIGGGWTFYANVFTDYPGCSTYEYGYGPFAAPNKTSGVSNIAPSATGQGLKVFSNYEDGVHAQGKCLETNVFQEMTVTAADAGTYDFTFDTEVSDTLGAGVSTYGFVKLIDTDDSLDLFQTVGTASGGSKTLTVTLDATADGKTLQWGFANTASNYVDSGRLYDNVSFAPQPPGPGSDLSYEGVPTLGTWGLMALLLLMGATAAVALVRRS